jgi:hypothetical protein
MAKRMALWGLFGLVGGYALSTWAGMHFTSWFFDPGKYAPVSCEPVIEQAFQKLLQIELWGTVGFFVLFLIVGGLWERARALKARAQVAATPPAAR